MSLLIYRVFWHYVVSGNMSNMINIARKEFSDLLGSKMVIVVLAGYLVFVLFTIFYLYGILSSNMGSNLRFGDNLGMAVSNYLFTILTEYYGPIIGVMIGCTSILKERQSNALNTLIVKPLYRDDIINGKLLGSLGFLMAILGFTIALYTSILLILCGDILAPTFGNYLSRLPLVFVFSTILISIFLTTSMLISILVKSPAFAMILGTLLVYISHLMSSSNLALPLSRMFPDKGGYIRDVITNMSPTGLLKPIRSNLFDSSISMIQSFQLVLPDMLGFVLFVLIACVLSYITFTMRDIS